MEQRKSERHTLSLKARLISRSVNCSGFIQNFSENSLDINLDPSALSTGIPDSTTFIVEFTPPAGETLSLQCRVARSQEGLEQDFTLQMVALEIIGRPAEYDTFLQSLN